MYKLIYDDDALQDLKKMDKQDRRFIIDSMDKFITSYSPAFEIELLNFYRQLSSMSLAYFKASSRFQLRTLIYCSTKKFF